MLAHSLQFSFLLALTSNYGQHLMFHAYARKGFHSSRFGPLYLAIFATILVMVQPALFVFKDVGCPVACLLRDYADELHVSFYVGMTFLLISALWVMGKLPRALVGSGA